VRIAKLAADFKNNFKKIFKKMLKSMFDLKEEAEYYSGQKMDLSEQIEAVFKLAKKKNKNISSDLIKQVKKIIKDKGKN